MSSKAQRFARMVLDAFDAAGRATDEQVAAAGGPSSTYMTGLRKAADGHDLKEPRSDTYRRIDMAAKWPAGSARSVWAGKDAPPPHRLQPYQPGEQEKARVSSPAGAIIREFARPSDALSDDELVQRVTDVKWRLDEVKALRAYLLEVYFDATTELAGRTGDSGWWENPEVAALRAERSDRVHGPAPDLSTVDKAVDWAREDVAADDQATSIEAEQEQTEQSP